jgi:hypothetical protein
MEVTMRIPMNKLVFGVFLLVLPGLLTAQAVSAGEAKVVFGVA